MNESHPASKRGPRPHMVGDYLLSTSKSFEAQPGAKGARTVRFGSAEAVHCIILEEPESPSSYQKSTQMCHSRTPDWPVARCQMCVFMDVVEAGAVYFHVRIVMFV